MTLAELVLLVAAGVGLYVLLRPLQRQLARFLVRAFVARPPRKHLPTIDVTDFTSDGPRQKEKHPE
jgi:hypothetical protein